MADIKPEDSIFSRKETELNFKYLFSYKIQKKKKKIITMPKIEK